MANNKVMFGGEVIMDLTDASAINPEDLAEGKSCYDRTGNKITGNSKWTQIPKVYKSPISLGDFDIGNPESYLCHLVKSASSIPLGQIEGTFSLPISGATLSVSNTSTTKATFTLVYDDTQQIAIPKITGATTTVNPTQVSSSIQLNYTFIIGGVRYTGYSRTVSFTYAYSVTTGSESDYLIIHSTANTSWTFSHTSYAGNITDADVTHIQSDTPYSTTRYFSSEEEYLLDYVIPINNNQDYIRFYIDTDNIFKAQSKINTISLTSASTAFATWGIDIIKVFYLAIDVVAVMWTYQANATTRATVYLTSIDLDGSGNIHSNSTYNRKVLFPSASHKLSWTDTNNVPYVYYGSLYKYNFRDGEWAIGIQYIRASVVSGSITQKYAVFGEIGFYTSASIANRIIMQTAQGSRMAQLVTATPTGSIRDIVFEESHGNVVSALLTTSAGVRVAVRYIYNAVSNDILSVPAPPWVNIQSVTNQTTLDFIDSNTDECRWLGRLDDGTYIIHNVTANKILVCSCRIARTALASKWNLLTNISISETDYADLRDTTHRPILLKSGILVGNEYIWQFTYSSGNYGLVKVGVYTKKNLDDTGVIDSTNKCVHMYGHYAIPIGRFSDLAEGIGGADVIADYSTT